MDKALTYFYVMTLCVPMGASGEFRETFTGTVNGPDRETIFKDRHKALCELRGWDVRKSIVMFWSLERNKL